MKKIKFLLLLSAVTILASCKKETPEPKEYLVDEGVFICNEGNFMSGNATLSFFNTKTNTISNQVFFNANNFPLGDVCQSMSIYGDYGFVVMNNSGKIMVININTFKHLATIGGLISPRYIEIISATKAYVTDFNNGQITVFNPSTFQKTGLINLGSSTEAICKLGNDVFVSSWSYNNKLYKINSLTNQVIDSLSLVIQPNSMVIDKNNKLWVLSDGGFEGSPYGWEKAAITRINPESFEIELVLEFTDKNSSPTKLCINGSKDTLFYLNGGWGEAMVESGICKMSILDNMLPANAFIPQGNRLFYGLAIDPKSGIVYVSNAVDYVQKGWMYRFSSQGQIIDSCMVDIGPGNFCFK